MIITTSIIKLFNIDESLHENENVVFVTKKYAKKT